MPGNSFSNQHVQVLEICGLAPIWSMISIGLVCLTGIVMWSDIRHWGTAAGRDIRALGLGVTFSQSSSDLNCFVSAALGIFQTCLDPAILVASYHIYWSPLTLFYPLQKCIAGRLPWFNVKAVLTKFLKYSVTFLIKPQYFWVSSCKHNLKIHRKWNYWEISYKSGSLIQSWF